MCGVGGGQCCWGFLFYFVCGVGGTHMLRGYKRDSSMVKGVGQEASSVLP